MLSWLRDQSAKKTSETTTTSILPVLELKKMVTPLK